MIEAKQVRAQKTRQKVLTTAQQLFDSQGFDGVSAEQIAKTAGVSKGTIFAHFGDKLGLLAELGQQEMDQKICLLEQAVAAGLSDRVAKESVSQTAICKGIDDLLNIFAARPEFLRVFIDQTTLHRGAYAESFNSAITRLHRALKSLVDQHKLTRGAKDLDSELTAVALRAYLLHLAVGQTCGEYKSRAMRQDELRNLVAALLPNTSG